jgi:hypothetical protein
VSQPVCQGGTCNSCSGDQNFHVEWMYRDVPEDVSRH